MSTTKPDKHQELIIPDLPPEFTFARQIDKRNKQWRLCLINTNTQEKFWSDWWHYDAANNFFRVNNVLQGLVEKAEAQQKGLEVLANFPDWSSV